MIEVNGKYTTAKVYTDVLEDSALEEIQILCDLEFTKDSKVRIMPDVHAGLGCVIGFTADLGDMVIPNIVGVDIGCGMMTIELLDLEIDYEELDNIIYKYVPSGKNVHDGRIARFKSLLDLHCYRELRDSKRIERSIGTLGGGNHFIEIDVDDSGNKYLVIHTGSRNLGKQIANYYQELAYDILGGKDKLFDALEDLIQKYKSEGKKNELQDAIKSLKKEFSAKCPNIPKNLCYLTGKYRDQYLHDMQLCQKYATLNRETIAEIILNKLCNKSLSDFNHFETVHNYIDLDSNIVRKGAVSAQKDEKILIPINMRDGSLICIGKGNPDWNYSAPHGAGRLFSRTTAKEKFTLLEYQESMKDIFTTSINQKTLDECPMAYKNINDIIKNIDETATVLKQIKPTYNYKSSD